MESGGGESCPVDVDTIPYSLPCGECYGTGYEVYLDCDDEPYTIDRDDELQSDLKAAGNADDIESIEWPTLTHGDLDGEWIAVNDLKYCGECDEGRLDVEIYEWWAVSGYLARKLEAAGEVVLEGEIWGRQGSGQAISMDGVIRGFAAELGDAWAE